MIWQNVRVLEPADSQDLVSLDEVKAYFNITNTTDDARLQSLITFNSSVIAGLCDRVFGLEKVEETCGNNEWDILEHYAICLKRYPVTEIDSITAGGFILSTDDYTIEYESGILRFWNLINDVVIIYSGGYDLPEEAPGPLSAACMEGLRSSYYYGSRDPMIQSVMDNNTGSVRFFPPPGISRTGGGSSGPSKPLSPTATALIEPYKRPALA
jgi:hypothetical protein